MKRVPILLLITLFFLSACKKYELAVYSAIEGNWELRDVQAGMIPNVNYPPGNGNRINFTKTEYTMYRNGQPVKSGTYRIQQDDTVEKEVCLSLPDDQFTFRIVYDHDYTTQKIFIQVDKSNLHFLSGCFALDGGSSRNYQRD